MLPRKVRASDPSPNSTRVVNTRSVEWLLALTQGSTPSGKEQNSEGLESIGDAVTSNDKSTAPMDDNKSDGDLKDDVKNATSKTTDAPSDEGSTTANGDDTNTSDDNADNDDSGDNEDDLGDNSDDSFSDDPASSGDGGDKNPQDPLAEKVDSPHLSLNRRILISTKLLALFDSINDSMERIANGPSFENKPTILENLNRLQNSVKLLQETVNKVKNYQTLLVEYAVCVRTYEQLICRQ